ncbi:secreted RxLR effector protein 161-like [Quercus suber]|uniref:secreted RxLR effector protein 161-like n=1 Tax=Quercus suber TaxID=58331 RepID=UPI0032DFEEC4
MDVKTVFLNGDLEEEIYMDQPEDFVKPRQESKDYASIIGSLRYATNCTRPDIAYAVGVLSRFTSKSSRDHWLAIKQVMRYVIGTKSYGLFYKKYPTVIEAFSDADWNTLSNDSLSTTGYIFTLDNGAICWKSKKQIIIANSTMETELIAFASASEKANWLRDLLYEIPLWESQFHLY